MTGRLWLAAPGLLAIGFLAACVSENPAPRSVSDPLPTAIEPTAADAERAVSAPPASPGGPGEPGEPAPSQDPQPAITLALDGALDLALREHPRLAQARFRIDAAEAEARAAGRLPNPNLIAGIESAPFEWATFSDAEFLLGVGQTIPLSNRLGRAEEVGWREREAAENEARAELNRVRRDVQGAFATSLFARDAAALQVEFLRTWSETLDLLQVQVEVGDAVEADVLAAELVYARASRRELQARTLATRALQELARAIGGPGRSIAAVEGDLAEALEVPSLEALVQRLDENPELLAAASRRDAAAARVELAEAQRIPDLRVDLLYRRIGLTDANGFDVFVAIPLPIFDRNRDRIDARRHELAAARAEQDALRGLAETELRMAHLDLSWALDDMAFHERELLPRAQELSEMAQARYELGDISLIELLLVRRAWIEVRMDALEARRGVVQSWAALSPFLAPVEG